MKRFHGGTLPHPACKVNRLNPTAAGLSCGMERSGPDQNTQRAAEADLARLSRAGDALSGLFGRGGEHFGITDTPASDPIELWGRRIGRALGAIAFVALCAYFYITYVR